MPDSTPDDPPDLNAQTREAWNRNATFWDEYMGEEGNDFQRLLVWEQTERLLAVRAGERVLDMGCGNGNFARRLAARGARMVGVDFAEAMIELAKSYPEAEGSDITYAVVDATDSNQLASLGEEPFDAAVANMALMDISDIGPLLRFLAKALRPGGRFLFSVSHPLVGTAHTLLREQVEVEGERREVYSIKVTDYLGRAPAPGLAITGQPRPHICFDRTLSDLLGECFETGLVMDALEEPVFPGDWSPDGGDSEQSERFRRFPPTLVVRLRRPEGGG